MGAEEEGTYHEDNGSYNYPGSKTSVCWFVIDTILCWFSCMAACVFCWKHCC